MSESSFGTLEVSAGLYETIVNAAVDVVLRRDAAPGALPPEPVRLAAEKVLVRVFEIIS